MNLYKMINQTLHFNPNNSFDKRIAKLFWASILIFFLFGKSIAQEATDYKYFDNILNTNMNIVDASVPDVKNIQRYDLSSIQEYSGKLNLSIPIFNIKTGKISYPINLNYNSGGVKIAEEASRVGLGWSLSNSIIVRKIMDGHDFDESGMTAGETDFTGYEGQGFDPNSSINKRLGYFKYKSQNATLHKKLAKIDLLPDIYNVFIPSGKSSFYYEDVNTPKELTVNEIKISSSINTIDFSVSGTNGSEGFTRPTKDFFSFKITDTDGLIYDFNNYDVASSLTYAPFSEIGLNIPNVSTWHISKITDPSTNNTVEFEYENAIVTLSKTEKKYLNRYVQTSALHSSCFNDIIRHTTINDQTSPLVHLFYNSYDGLCSPDYIKMTGLTEYYKINRLKKITFPEGYITFHYDLQREDVNFDDKALSKIKIYDYNNKLIKEFSLEYDYFECNSLEGTSTDPYNCKRLKLSSVQETGLPPYEFEYIENIGLPRKNSRAFDFLGYYNGKHKSYNDSDVFGLNVTMPTLYYYPNKGAWSILPFEITSEEHFELKDDENDYNLNRKSNSTYAQQGTLKKMTFPTGGYEKFEYELNSFQIFGETINGGGLRVKKQVINDGKNHETVVQHQYTDDNNQSSGHLVRPPMYGFPQGSLFDSYYELNPPDQETDPGYIVTDYNGFSNWNSRKIYNAFYLTDYNTMDIDINNNAFVGYSQTRNIYPDGSYDKTVFTSRLDYPDQRGFGFYGYNDDVENRGGPFENEDGFFDEYIPLYNFSTYGEFLQTNSNYEGSLYTDFSQSRGLPLFKYKYDQNNVKRKKIEYEYEPVDFNNVLFKKPLYSSELNIFDGNNGCCVLGIFYYGEARVNYKKSRFKPTTIKEKNGQDIRLFFF